MFTYYLKKIWPDAAAIVVFLLISFAYFFTPLSEGLVLGGHDSQAAAGLGRETRQYYEQTGDYSRWMNSLFSGMPTYQISPSYKSTQTLTFVEKIYMLGTTGAFSYVFVLLLGFYILLRAFNFKSYLSALGAILWAFSSYFLIIIAAGHLWKVMTLAFIPPTIGGIILCYRKKWGWGAAVTGLFTALQIMSNHIQMTYYFAFLIGFVVLAYGIAAVVQTCRKQPMKLCGQLLPALSLKDWAKATGIIVMSGLLGICANLPNLYHTYEYAKHSMRGPAELTPLASEAHQATKTGLQRDYITQWSYGIGETLTLLIPDFNGGGSASILDRDDATDLKGYDTFYQCAGSAQQMFAQQGQQITPPGLSQYWGNQPFTVGPVYVGALVCFLFIFGLFSVKSPIKWALLAGTLLSFLFAWGHNFPEFTNFCIDHLPMYNKFRTPSSALVVAEFTMPLLAIMALARILRHPQDLQTNKQQRIGLIVSLALTVGVCVLLWIAPGLAGNCISANDQQILSTISANGGADFARQYSAAISEMHHDILSSSALRSLLFLLAGILPLAAYVYYNKGKEKPQGKVLLCAILAVVCLSDLAGIDKRYLNNDSFTDPVQLQELQPTPADQKVMADHSDYRVVDLSQGNPFNETSNHSVYFHQSIGGYNAAKLHRYQDLIDRCLQTEIQNLATSLQEHQGDFKSINGDSIAAVLNMLNTKYVIFGTQAEAALQNPYANGNGWFVQSIQWAKNPDEEMAALKTLDTKRTAVADERFKATLEGSALDSGKVMLTKRLPNELHYTITTPKGGVAVLSEIYYPGWKATIDGQPVAIGRVNYVLRAIKVPAGQHEVVFTYHPDSISATNTMAYIALSIILLLFVAALFYTFKPCQCADTRSKEN